MAPTGEDGLTCKWNGPYKVKKKIGDVTYLIDAPCKGRQGKICHRNLLKRHLLQVSTATIITANPDEDDLDSLSIYHLPFKEDEDKKKTPLGRRRPLDYNLDSSTTRRGPEETIEDTFKKI